MAVAEGKDRNFGSGIITSKVKVLDVNSCDEAQAMTRKDGSPVLDKDTGEPIIQEFPYKIKLQLPDSKVMEERTLGILEPRDWNKKFYLGRSIVQKDGSNVAYYNVSYTRDNLLPVLFFIHQAKKGEVDKTNFSINDLIGLEFDAVAITSGDNAFLDIPKTLMSNGFSMPKYFEVANDYMMSQIEKDSREGILGNKTPPSLEQSGAVSGGSVGDDISEDDLPF